MADGGPLQALSEEGNLLVSPGFEQAHRRATIRPGDPQLTVPSVAFDVLAIVLGNAPCRPQPDYALATIITTVAVACLHRPMASPAAATRPLNLSETSAKGFHDREGMIGARRCGVIMSEWSCKA